MNRYEELQEELRALRTHRNRQIAELALEVLAIIGRGENPHSCLALLHIRMAQYNAKRLDQIIEKARRSG